MKKRILSLLMAVMVILSLTACDGKLPPIALYNGNDANSVNTVRPDTDIYPNVTGDITYEFDYGTDVPAWDGKTAWVEINDNTPFFTGDDVDRANNEVWEEYSELDELGRCGVAYANLCWELAPTEERGNISGVKPTGWHTVTYPEVINDRYLYNRCHLIGFQLAGENANKQNLITGTRFMNIEGMLDFEDLLDDYIYDGHIINEDRHVLYRVTPVFLDDELVARGVLMEGYSVPDMGRTVCFCVFAYNNQPGVEIDYATGDSWLTHSIKAGG